MLPEGVNVSQQEVDELLETAGRGDEEMTMSILQSTDSVEKRRTLIIELLLSLSIDDEDHPGINVIKAVLRPFSASEGDDKIKLLFRNLPWFNMRGNGVYKRARFLLHFAKNDESRFYILSFSRFILFDHIRSHFHQAFWFRNTEVVRAMLDSVGQEYRFRLMTMRDEFKHAPLHDLTLSTRQHQGPVDSKEFVLTKTMLACVSNEQRYEILTMLNADDRIPFVDAFIHGHNDVVEGIKSSLSSEEWYTLLSSEQIRSFRGSDRKAYVTEAKVNAIIDIYATEQSGW